jgi:cytochrome P450
MAAKAATTLPPGPRLPKWMQTAGFLFAPVPFIETCRRRYGDVVTFSSLFDSRFVMVFDPELVKQVFRGSPEQLRAGEANALLGPVVGERSVLLLDGAEHLRQRKLLLPPFHGERMRAYEQVMREAADRVIDSWPIGEEIVLLRSMQSLTLEVIARAVFGVDQSERRAELIKRVRAMIDPVGSRFGLLIMVFSRSRRGESKRVEEFEARRRAVDELIFGEIADRRDQADLEEREDVLSMLLQARDEDGDPMTDQELRDELVTLLVAGHETTATGLAWAFERLVRHPGGLERLTDDSYAEAVAQETLRLRPPIPIVARRVVGEPFSLGGRAIPVGVMIAPCIYLVHRRPDVYPDPYAFRPERFLERAPETYTWLPFGGGMRRCIGASFAVLEMSAVLRTVARGLRLAPASPEPERVSRRAIVFAPSRGGSVVVAG